jgi:hypothetical protein
LYSVALVGERDTEPAEDRRGLTWLVGMDANDSVVDDHERRLVADHERRLVAHGGSPR